MKKLLTALRRTPKRAAGLLMVAAAILIPATLWAWGPERATFTVENAAPYVTFNSITNHQRVGDERNFVRIKEANTNANFTDSVELQAGKTYEVMVFYHNNAKRELNDQIGEDGLPVGVARDVTARVQMPGRVDANSKATITGLISASNANPGTVWDNAYATTKSAVALRYVQGSAKIASSNGAVNGTALSSDLLTTGVKLGHDKLDGKLPGCNEFSGYITYQFTVDKPDFTIAKQLSVDGGKTWVDSAKTTPGSTIQYRLVYQNTGTVQQDNVILKDTLPAGISYIAGTSEVANSKTGGTYQKTVDGITASGGYKLGSYAPRGNAYFKYSAKIAKNDDLAKCGANKLTNTVVAHTENGSKSDTAEVIVDKECKPEPPKDIKVCELKTKKIVTIKEDQFNSEKHSRNLDDCKEKPQPEKIEVCDTKNNTIVTIDRPTYEYDQDRYTTDLAQCEEKPVTPEVPEELPQTGATASLAGILALGAVSYAVTFYVTSRRNV